MKPLPGEIEFQKVYLPQDALTFLEEVACDAGASDDMTSYCKMKWDEDSATFAMRSSVITGVVFEILWIIGWVAMRDEVGVFSLIVGLLVVVAMVRLVHYLISYDLRNQRREFYALAGVLEVIELALEIPETKGSRTGRRSNALRFKLSTAIEEAAYWTFRAVEAGGPHTQSYSSPSDKFHPFRMMESGSSWNRLLARPVAQALRSHAPAVQDFDESKLEELKYAYARVALRMRWGDYGELLWPDIRASYSHADFGAESETTTPSYFSGAKVPPRIVAVLAFAGTIVAIVAGLAKILGGG